MIRLLLLCTVAFTLLVGWSRVWLDQLLTLPSAVTALEVEAGTPATRVLSRLAPTLTPLERRLVFQLYPSLAAVQVGQYRFAEDTSVVDAMRSIRQGDAITHRLTVPEGITVSEFFDSVMRHQALKWDSIESATRWHGLSPEYPANEGAFLAETYVWTAQLSADKLLETAHKALTEALERAWEARTDAVDAVLDSPYELLILASIIEKETALTVERPRIAGVFIERLRRGMRLQTDPTVIYGLGERFDGNLTRRHLREKTPYNTYRIDGLPPTPIALVGPDALMATAQPEITGHLYFVADGSGGHAFSKTLKEHNANVRKYQLGRSQ